MLATQFIPVVTCIYLKVVLNRDQCACSESASLFPRGTVACGATKR